MWVGAVCVGGNGMVCLPRCPEFICVFDLYVHMFVLSCQAETRAVTGPDCEIDGPTGSWTRDGFGPTNWSVRALELSKQPDHALFSLQMPLSVFMCVRMHVRVLAACSPIYILINDSAFCQCWWQSMDVVHAFRRKSALIEIFLCCRELFLTGCAEDPCLTIDSSSFSQSYATFAIYQQPQKLTLFSWDHSKELASIGHGDIYCTLSLLQCLTQKDTHCGVTVPKLRLHKNSCTHTP